MCKFSSSSLLGNVSVVTQQPSTNVFGFGCTGIKDSYATAIAAIGIRLQKIFLY
jgi:hypothetical protein